MQASKSNLTLVPNNLIQVKPSLNTTLDQLCNSMGCEIFLDALTAYLYLYHNGISDIAERSEYDHVADAYRDKRKQIENK